jgi:hypothetical protein
VSLEEIFRTKCLMWTTLIRRWRQYDTACRVGQRQEDSVMSLW